VKTRVTLRKGGRQYRTLLLRLEKNQVRCETHSCPQLLEVLRTRPVHAVYACDDETLHLCTSARVGGRADQEIVMTLLSYRQPVRAEAETSNAVRVVRKNHWRR